MEMSKNSRKFAVMKLVESDYVTLGLRDAVFADHAAKFLGFEVKRATITQARLDLGIANTTPVSTQSEVARLRDLFIRCEPALSKVDEEYNDYNEIAEANYLLSEIARLRTGPRTPAPE
jgi:hypothetical protein